MNRLGAVLKKYLIDKITIDLGVFVVFFLVTIIFVFTILRSF
ncbi:MAG: hypothetical protein PHD06_00330 [Bacteroidales bacterium]|nr:hypothetical protein [Bacteroidales bacterium]MDD4383604.1 hypothetical protein [Bacteroidales bacterium]MDY0197347.1 hypothetical protein [Tenuifilaceae bacterium]